MLRVILSSIFVHTFYIDGAGVKMFSESSFVYIVLGGHTETADFLLKNGASVNRADRMDNTPLTRAVCNNHNQMVTLLLAWGARVNYMIPDRGPIPPFGMSGRSAGLLPVDPWMAVGNRAALPQRLPLPQNFGIVGVNGAQLPMNPLMVGGIGAPIPRFGIQVVNRAVLPPSVIPGANFRSRNFQNRSALDLCVSLRNMTSQDSNEVENHKISKRYCVSILYAAGATFCPSILDNLDEYRDIIPQFVLDDQEPMLSLEHLCRKVIRAHLMGPIGGNKNNLIIAVPHLPLPQFLKDFLLYNVKRT